MEEKEEEEPIEPKKKKAKMEEVSLAKATNTSKPKKDDKDKDKQKHEQSEPSAASAPTKKRKKADKTETTDAKTTKSKKESKTKKKEEEPQGTVDEDWAGWICSWEAAHKKKLQKFFRLYDEDRSTTITETHKTDIKDRLKCQDFTEFRLNAYWKTGACGLHCRTLKKDLVHYAFKPDGVGFVCRMALAMKCCEMFATRFCLWCVRNNCCEYSLL